MVTISDDIKKFVESQRVSYVATCSKEGKPNVSPKGKARVIDDRTLAFCDLFSKKTHKNLLENPLIAVSVVNEDELEGYQFVGTAVQITEGPLFDRMSREMSIPHKWAPSLKRVIKIKVKEIYDLTPPGEYYLE